MTATLDPHSISTDPHPTATGATAVPVASGPEGDVVTPTERLMGLAAGVGPVLLAGSSLAWLAGDDHAELRGVLMFWAVPALALTITGLAGRLDRAAPAGRAVITTMMAIGAVAGGAFAQEINMVDFFGTERLLRQDTPSAVIALGLPGLLFPISMITTGVLSAVHRTMPRAQALLLAVAACGFPLSRIPEQPGIAVVADLLLSVALVPVAVSAVRRSLQARRARRAA